MVPLVAGAPTAVIPGDHLDYRDRLAAFAHAQVPVLSAAPVTDPTLAQVLSVTPPGCRSWTTASGVPAGRVRTRM